MGELQIYFDLYEQADTRLAEQEAQQIVTLLHPSERAGILDVCCGYGRHSIPLAQRGFQVTGVDLSARAYTVAELKALVEEVGLRFDAVDGSLAGEEYTLDSPSAIIIAAKP